MDKKKQLGQFSTDRTIAEYMVDSVFDEGVCTFLDPAVGTGVFSDIVSKKYKNIDISVCEIDESLCKNFKSKKTYSYKMYKSDYLQVEFKNKFDLIICNPPYNKFHEIENRKDIITLFRKKYGISLSGYSSTYIYFLVKSMNELNENGKCCYIVPYEFLNTGYGKIIKEYFLKTRMLKSILKFSNKLSLFDDALTTSCIILLENKHHSVVDFIHINDLNELKSHSQKNVVTYNYNELDPSEKWSKYFNENSIVESFSNLVSVNTFGKISRGIATGNNNYFVLRKEKIDFYNLSEQVCMPCLTKSCETNFAVITKSAFNQMVNENKKVFIFNGENASCDEDYQYIKIGVEIGADKAYLTSHRNPWYQVEKKNPAPILVSVFSRNKIKFIRNEMLIHNLTSFHGFYLKDSYNNDKFINIMYCYFLTPIAQKILYLNKREYGNGLDKFEPNDLNKAKMLNINILSDNDKEEVLQIYDKIKTLQTPTMIDELNVIFSKYLLTQKSHNQPK